MHRGRVWIAPRRWTWCVMWTRALLPRVLRIVVPSTSMCALSALAPTVLGAHSPPRQSPPKTWAAALGAHSLARCHLIRRSCATQCHVSTRWGDRNCWAASETRCIWLTRVKYVPSINGYLRPIKHARIHILVFATFLGSQIQQFHEQMRSWCV